MFATEAEGLQALRELGGISTPDVLAVNPHLLVLQALEPRPDDDRRFWEHLERRLANLHNTTIKDRFGWHRDGWLGRLRQDNTWTADGHTFFIERRVLRWLSEPAVEAVLDFGHRQGLERLCAALPTSSLRCPPY